jgi:hypothetical protein
MMTILRSPISKSFPGHKARGVDNVFTFLPAINTPNSLSFRRSRMECIGAI